MRQFHLPINIYPYVLFLFLFTMEKVRPFYGKWKGGTWYLKVLFLLGLTIALRPITVKAYFYSSEHFWHLLDKTPRSWGASALVGTFAFSLGNFMQYWLHRWRHEYKLLWRFHQIHHSPRRFEACVATFTHPIEHVTSFLCFIFVGGILGAQPHEMQISLMIYGLLDVFSHANIELSPRLEKFLSIFMATPALHSLHHEGPRVCNMNYSVTPIFDRMFGTFEAPRPLTGIGFAEEQSARFGALLLGKLVYQGPDGSSEAVPFRSSSWGRNPTVPDLQGSVGLAEGVGANGSLSSAGRRMSSK